MVSVSEVLTKAASLCDRGVCRGANARLANSKAVGCFNQEAAYHSMYGALVAVLGPGLGDDRALQASAAWKMIAMRAWDEFTGEGQKPGTLKFSLHDLNDALPGDPGAKSLIRGDLFRKWAADAQIESIGEWK